MTSNVDLGTRVENSSLSKDMAGQKVTVAGWLQDTRNLGGIAFLLLRDRTGIVQITCLKKKLGDESFAKLTTMPRESVLAVIGELKLNEQVSSGFEILPESFELIAEAQTPLPLGVADKVGVELDTRLNNRFLDLRKPQVLAVFKLREILIRAMREYLVSLRFMEVTTSKIVAAGAEGGSTLFPVEYFGKKAYLAQSPQLYKQMLMGAGLDRIYELAPAFRAEQSDTVRHIAEFASLDIEMSFIKSEEDVMNLLQDLMVHALEAVLAQGTQYLEELGVEVSVPKTPFPRITFTDAVKMLVHAGLEIQGDLDTEAEKRLGELMLAQHGAEMYFITKFPSELKKTTFYAMRDSSDSELTNYFDLDYRGEELVSGGQREHRLDILINQMEDIGYVPKDFEFYLQAFRYGMPPHGGFGLGIERVLHMMLRLPNIRECVMFPRDMYRVVP
ncbi:MAG: aspartate--tRNA(Asn) ligase [Candidatus Thermoplasmatota archaeon]|nr:aspartate--tRNA(Asn) ligase [Euryarchaeota archaeon]MBU4031473.1 aspartate--tRNA(Asn) ligase [Candidatus Thermoplasmatota archaeon]MBU4072213.1 aspartate--tRNA(Asn) ligase [Candidatus Thermoplasmatota archaeon]MBU4143974.1 aspartate--tRNA(Asn) ligase [Candidatus Thermoplasmatota archaeon]MBU4591912.1 aspartate--tRNA(Asn) ligase [Candidatus Thermoplasmatota archaeon]